MEKLSLSELKAQNAKAEEAKTEEAEEELLIDDPIVEAEEHEKDETTETLEDSTDDTDETKTDEESEDLEDWQKSETKTKSGKKFIPNAEAKKLRLKAKELKADAKEKDAQLEELRKKVEQLTVSQPSAEVVETLPSRPKLEDFDYDEEKHNEALDGWLDKKIELKLKKTSSINHQKQLQEAQQQAAFQQREKAVEAHLNKAASLINDGKITQDSWVNSDRLIRQTLDLVLPGKGNQLADQFISLMESNGEGSEKVWYYLGNNPSALSEFRDKVIQDNTGASALMYLSTQQARASKPSIKKRSGAPRPADNISGDATSGSTAGIKKAYDKAGKSGDIQTRITLKRKAKKAGIDVSSW